MKCVYVHSKLIKEDSDVGQVVPAPPVSNLDSGRDGVRVRVWLGLGLTFDSLGSKVYKVFGTKQTIGHILKSSLKEMCTCKQDSSCQVCNKSNLKKAVFI